jgi:hypothetical protein
MVTRFLTGSRSQKVLGLIRERIKVLTQKRLKHEQVFNAKQKHPLQMEGGWAQAGVLH